MRAGTPPSPEVDPGREARIALYAERAERGEDLMTGIKVTTGPEPEQDEPTARELRNAARVEARRLAREEAPPKPEPEQARPCAQCGQPARHAKRGRPTTYCSRSCRRRARCARTRAEPAPEHVAACLACGAEVRGTKHGGSRKRYCGPACCARWNEALRTAEKRGSTPPEPGSRPPPAARRKAQAERQERAAQSAPQRDGGFAGAMRRAVYADAREQAAGSPLLRALAAGLRAAADVLDEALRADGGAA